MKQLFTAIVLFLVMALPVRGQMTSPAVGPADIAGIEHAGARLPAGPASVASEWLDVIYYRLDLRISATPGYLRGRVTIEGRCTPNHPSFLVLDFADAMQVDSIIIDGKRCGFTRAPASIIITLDSSSSSGTTLSASIDYQGMPLPTGHGSFEFTTHDGSTPWIWSLSEPYGARDWWPCRDHPSDKADSLDIYITTDSALSTGSNGVLVSIADNGDGTRTTHWHESYPISSYLVSVAISNFSKYTDWFRYSPVDSMPVLNYVLPESLEAARRALPVVIDGLKIFSDLFGLYPFIAEKYGHSEFGSGAMEHQTMTSTVGFDEPVLIHELAHQWFGDMITCRTWSDVWLNEGFASYCEALYQEKKYGTEAYSADIAGHFVKARNAGGPVHVIDTNSVSVLFSGPTVYSKGAIILHMLRHVLGDSVFFHAMHIYANDPALRYGTASTTDFRNACERASGINLGWFFDEWIYGTGYPHYFVTWSRDAGSGGRLVTLTITQSNAGSNPQAFTMPVDLKFTGATGLDTTVTVTNSSGSQNYSFNFSLPVDTIRIDPGDWILKEAVILSGSTFPGHAALRAPFPNPFRNAVVVSYELSHRTHIRLSVFNLLGEEVDVLAEGEEFAGPHVITWNATSHPVGGYFLRLALPDENFVRPLMLTR
jgi:aminopeptidase N